MFKAKLMATGEILPILSVEYDEYFHKTYFFTWIYKKWQWMDAILFSPPNE